MRLTSLIIMLCMCSYTAFCDNKGYDLCIYGGNASAVVAAYTAASQGQKVLLVAPEKHIGGLTTGGLGYTDIGNKQAVQGVARQFYRKVGEHYGNFEQWIFEPHVASDILNEYLDTPGITIVKDWRLVKVRKKGTVIKSIRLRSNESLRFRKVKAVNFIDCSYEGDLMAAAEVSYTIGREDNSVYEEMYNGVQMRGGHQFPDGVDPYVEKGNPESGLLWGISEKTYTLKGDKLILNGAYDTDPATGFGNDLVQAYNIRLCMTDSLENMIPVSKPDNYDPSHYELLLRLFEAQPEKRTLNDYLIISRMPGRKTDMNNRGAFSTDMIGMNWNYPEASYRERKKILKAHLDYTNGLLYFMGHDERVPEEIRNEMLSWGWPKDEYLEFGNMTPQVYLRECRRMVGEYVATQADCENRVEVTDGVGMAAYTMDSHNCERVVLMKDGVAMVKNEGNTEIPGGKPYPISYRSLTPKRNECTNLLVPVCLSASHIAFGSIRMEPVFMNLGQSCATATTVALRNGISILQEVDAADIRKMMEENPYADGSSPEIIIDDCDASVEYSEGCKTIPDRAGYGPTTTLLRNGSNARVKYNLPELDGEYDLYSYQILYDNFPATAFHIVSGENEYDASYSKKDDATIGQTAGAWCRIGTFRFNKGTESYIELRHGTPSTEENTNFNLKADALLLIRK